MKIEIDISDFYLEEEDLETGLKEYVKREVLNEIQKSIKQKVEDHLTLQIKAEVEKNMYQQMNLFIKEFIKTGEVKSSVKSGTMVNLEEYVKEKFSYDSGWGSANETVKDLAKKFGTEMKQRYDLLFASQLVSKMHENQMLKDDVAQKLLSDNK